MRNETLNGDIRPVPDKRFLRFHKAFGDAVRSRSRSAIVEVLLCAQLSGDRARRTAEKILADRRHHV